VITYGLESGNDWSAADVQSDGDGMKFRVKYKGEAYGEFRLAAIGHHNVLNALAALVIARGAGSDARPCNRRSKPFAACGVAWM